MSGLINDIFDFSSTDPPKLNVFFCKLALLTSIWIPFLSVVRKFVEALAEAHCSHDIPVASASIPSKLPHPNPPGSAVPFEIPLKKASDEKINEFLLFRGKKNWLKLVDEHGKEQAMQIVANYAAAYKGDLYEERTMKWVDDHFRLKLPNLKYPYVDRHWQSWSSFWVETAPHIRQMILSSTAIIAEHTINGLVFPLSYLVTKNPVYYNLAVYGEAAFLTYTSILILLSHQSGKDLTIEQMHPAVWNLLLLHHIVGMLLCLVCIMTGDSSIRDFACNVLLVLLGFTSSLHYVGQILDFSPLSQANKPYSRLCLHVFCLVSQLLFRGVYWLILFYNSVVYALEVRGVAAAVSIGLIMFLFSLFNVDFIKFHVKATKGCWEKIKGSKKSLLGKTT